MTRSIEVRPGHYHDSVTLMLVSQSLSENPAVAHAQVSMGTALNLELLADAGYVLPPEATAGDLLIAIQLTDEAAADEHVDATIADLQALVEELLAQTGAGAGGSGVGGSGGTDDLPPRSITSAATAGRATAAGRATVALISVPGPHAHRTALEAIEAGLHPIVFSDNVSVVNEVAIKRAATAAGLVAMGPDCGTVVLDGVGLGFANAVVPGPIGLVSASGTGAQQVCALADQAGVGVRHVIGLGGRDLDDEVGGLSAEPALRLLDADPAVEVIGIVAKSIGPATTTRLDEVRASLSTPTVPIGVDDLTAATADLLRAAGVEPPTPTHWAAASPRPPRAGRVVGLYSGGTLSAEAERTLSAAGLPAGAIDVVDLGDDEFTRGRPHPMIDDRLRLDRLAEAIADPSVGVILLDVVLGHGCLADPAAGLTPLIAATEIPVHVALVATAGDPQGRDAQAAALSRAGAEVWLSNSAAARAAAATVDPSSGEASA